MATSKIKKDDLVKVIAGKDKGKEGKIIAKKGDKVLVEGINMVKKHVKPNGQTAGSIVDMEAPIHASNVMIIDPKTKKPTRIGKKMIKDKKVRIAVKSSEKLD